MIVSALDYDFFYMLHTYTVHSLQPQLKFLAKISECEDTKGLGSLESRSPDLRGGIYRVISWAIQLCIYTFNYLEQVHSRSRKKAFC